MMHQATHLLQWHIVLMERGLYANILLLWIFFNLSNNVILLVVTYSTIFLLFYFLPIGCFLAGQIRMENHTWLSGMKVKEL